MSTPWPQEREEHLKVLWLTGLSVSRIGDELGLTKSTVSGKLDRLGLKRGHVRPQRVRVPRGTQQLPPPVKAAPQPPAIPEPSAAHRCSILKLTNSTCRWLDMEEAPWLYCGAAGADLDNKMPYCPYHMRIAYRRPGEREGA